MRSFLFAFIALFAAGACGDGTASTHPSGGSSGVPNPTGSSSSSSSGGAERDAGDEPDSGAPSGPGNVRVLAGNLTSGSKQSYDDGEGQRILQGVKPDIALLQEFNYGTKDDAAIRTFVTDTFGANYTYFRENGAGLSIPNGVVSRFPIVDSGRWPDAPNRGFVYAKIEVPGAHPLWAVSVHLLTTGSSERNASATALVGHLKEVVKDGEYVVIGGDLNTDSRNEACLATLQELVDAAGSHAADKDKNETTNAPRSKPYDWVLGSPELVKHQVPTVIGGSSFANGLVVDTRIYTPISELAPAKSTDSGASNMQHMAVVKDFKLD